MWTVNVLVISCALSLSFSCIESATVPGRAVNKTLTIGYLLSWSHEWAVGPFIGSAVVVAIQEIHRRQLLPGYHIEWVHEDTWCQSTQGIKAAVGAWSRSEDLDVLIGGGCSIVCQPVSLLAAAWGLPVVSYGCASDVLSDKKIHPTFSRSVGLYVHLAKIFYDLADVFDWNHVAIISDSVDLFLRMAREMENIFKANGKTTVLYTMQSTITDTVNNDNLNTLRQILRVLKSQCRIIFLLQYSLDVRNTLALAYEEDMLEGFVYIGTESELPLDINTAFRPDLGLELYEGVIDAEIGQSFGIPWDTFRQNVVDEFQSDAFAHLEHIGPDSPIDAVNSFAGTIHDALLMWAYGVNKTLEQGFPPDDGFRVTQNIFNLSFEGITGTVIIDEYGDRKSNYALDIVRDGKPITFLEYVAAKKAMEKRYKPNLPGDWDGLVWPGGQTTVPKDAPECGWLNEFCEEEKMSMTTLLAIVAVVIVAMAIAVIIVSILVRNHRYQVRLKGASQCRISWNDVEETGGNVMGSRATLKSAAESHAPQMFSHVVRYKSDLAAVKSLGVNPVDVSDRKVLEDLMAMRDFHHDNINAFLGVCFEVPNACILMAYAARGSLQDVLQHEDIKLTWDFQVSLMTDVAKGMKIIHGGQPGWHGRLTSSNCVVDSRWICKITDYGLHHIKQSASSGETVNPSPSSLLWTAPELLRTDSNKLDTKKGDVYSFGIICQEIVLQAEPYEGSNEPAEVIIEKVKQPLEPLFRPLIPQDSCPSEWKDLICSCWKENPDSRPTVDGILLSMKTINGGNEVNLVDSMIKRLEEHSNKLEAIVVQRSQMLFDEKEKMEFLLRELLPKSIAESLKFGHAVDPETFEQVTIFFSDVVSFTRISAAGTPIDVVKMLNLMYTVFDDVAAKFDVYKVATIGDAYFVASGVPERNGDRHASEICRMALELLKVAGNLPIPHIPAETLKLRIGIHSGPCLAGVAGVKMPRYLLFGDTVDFASSMEAGGMSMRIHVSIDTADLLKEDARFLLEERPEGIEHKTRGKIKTFWLNGFK